MDSLSAASVAVSPSVSSEADPELLPVAASPSPSPLSRGVKETIGLYPSGMIRSSKPAMALRLYKAPIASCNFYSLKDTFEAPAYAMNNFFTSGSFLVYSSGRVKSDPSCSLMSSLVNLAQSSSFSPTAFLLLLSASSCKLSIDLTRLA